MTTSQLPPEMRAATVQAMRDWPREIDSRSLLRKLDEFAQRIYDLAKGGGEPKAHAPLRIFVGYDSKEPLAYYVLAHSILRRTSLPVSIEPLALHQLRRIYTRERGPTESTEFSMTRFLVPYLCGYEGHAVFMDCDMLCRADVAELLLHAVAHPDKAVLVCQHEYTPKHATKFLGQAQTAYPRKNWSSLMVFNNRLCAALTPEYVNTATGLDLHRLNWIPDAWVGALPLEWNWLVGEYEPNHSARMLHYTLGGPWFEEHAECDHAEDWLDELSHMMRCGRSAETGAGAILQGS